MNKLLSLLLICSTFFSFGQRPTHLIKPSDSLDTIAFINTVQQSLNLFYADYASDLTYDSIINSLKYEPNQAPVFSDDIYCSRLEKMSAMSPFKMDCNASTLSTIRFFATQRRGFIRVALGRSALYFDMFRDKLAEYGLPIELRFLSVIESGLRPQVKSKAGALGLWQFMYKTGLYFGLEENSYIDERMDPDKATDAACRYLKQLYGIYGDWNLALAAYNAGPGNVNKAIRRSGDKKTYWEVRPFLPTETQGYVPNFIAAAYLMTYHAEHNIIPMEAKIHNVQLDTMCLKNGMHMNTIAKLALWDEEEIKTLNPVYKSTYIPKTTPAQCITGPMEKITFLVSMEDSLYILEQSIYGPVKSVPLPPVIINDTLSKVTGIINDSLNNPKNLQYHKVQTSENLKNIALKYNVSVDQLMEWNALRTTNIYVGQRLKLYSKESVSIVTVPKPVVPKRKYYAAKSGDTFSRIAQKNNLSIGQLQKLNPGIKINRIIIGQRLRIK